MPDKKTTILIVEDEVIIAQGIKLALIKLGYKITAITGSADGAIELARKDRPDLVLMDIELGTKKDGITAAGQITSQLDIPVVFLTAYFDEATLDRAKLANPSGYITKPFKDQDLHVAIKMALHKYRSFHAENNQLMRHFQMVKVTVDLTPREKEICCLVKGGFSDAEIASNLFISPHTIRSHIKSIYQKFGVKSRAKLVAWLNMIMDKSASMN